MFDIVISGGTVVDGSGSPAFPADVGIENGRIAAMGDLSLAEAKRVIDARGHAVSPGFIDTHTHSEGSLLLDPQHANGLRQGITTEFLGIDGMSYAPLSADNYRMYRKWLSGLLEFPPEDLDMSSVAAFRSNYDRKVSVNTAYLVPNGTVRLEAVGFRDVPLTGESMERYKRLVIEGLEQGAVGFTTGSSYYPGPWTSTAELVEICKTVREHGGVYMAEPRRANRERAHGGGGVPEVLEIGRRSGVSLHFAHYRTAPETAGRIDYIMSDIDRAKEEGADITLDIYPYPAGSSIPVSYLPSYAQEGGPDALLERLGDPAEREKMAYYLDNEYDRPLDEVVFCYLPRNSHLEGVSLPDIVRETGETLGEGLCRLLLEEELAVGYLGAPPVSTALWQQVSRDCMELLSRSDYMVCSDITPAGSMPHPRSYGAFPRFLGRLRRQFGLLTLEQMVQRMTDNPARRFGLTGRGRIEKGYYADMVVFDPERVIDTATYDNPRQFPIGIPYVVVNGEVAVDNDHCTGVLAGRAIP